VKKSVEDVNLGFVDLFLIHSPTFGPEGRQRLWTALEDAQSRGLVKSIGVSNFGVKHLQQLKESSRIMPAVNQIELHPWCQQREIVEYCKSENIAVQAYCPLVRGEKFKDETLVKISQKHGKSPAHVLLRWSLQKGYIPLPKSDTPSRIESNADVFDFELSEEDMSQLDSLDEGSTAAVVAKSLGFDPTQCE